MDNSESTEPKKQKRGFAAMSPEKRSELASLGGRRAHALGVAHTFTSETARIAGRLGANARKFSLDSKIEDEAIKQAKLDDFHEVE